MFRKLGIAWGIVQPETHEQASVELARSRAALMEAEGRREEAVARVAMLQSRAARLARTPGYEKQAAKARLELLEAEGKLEAEHAHCEMYRARIARLETAAVVPVDYNRESLA